MRVRVRVRVRAKVRVFKELPGPTIRRALLLADTWLG